MNAIHRAPDPAMFVFRQREFTWYALLFVSGWLGAHAIAARTMMAEGIDIVYVNVLLIFVTLGVVIGARLGEIVFYQFTVMTRRGSGDRILLVGDAPHDYTAAPFGDPGDGSVGTPHLRRDSRPLGPGPSISRLDTREV